MNSADLASKLREAIRQLEEFTLMCLEKEDMEGALEAAGRITRQQELLRLLEERK